jgi:HAD superfamily hydrolase (TIGR01458 family)
MLAGVRGVLLDIDGVLTVSWRPLPGAVAAMRWLREAGLPVALLTNTTSRTRSSIAGTLAGEGFPVTDADVLTAPAITASYLASRYPGASCALLNSGDVTADLAGIRLDGDNEAAAPDVVIIGGAGPEFSYPALNRAFGRLCGGARLVAMHRNMYWRTSAGLQLDGGAFLAGLELASGVQAEVTGKPSAAFFEAGLAALGVPAATAVMVGDDLANDVLAAQRAGITGVLVRTGKYRPGEEHAAEQDASPDHVIDSVADLPGLLRAE